MYDEHVGERRRLGYRREIAQGVVRHLLVHDRIDRESARGHQDRVPVGGRFGGELDAYHLAGAGAVVDDELLAERFGELLREGAGDDVCAAAGRRGHDEAHGLRRIRHLRRGPGADQGQQEKRRGRKRISLDHGSSIFLVSTTRFHFSISVWPWRRISSGLLALGVPHHSAKRCAISGSATTRLISRLIRSTIAPGMPGGPAIPRKELAS